MLGGTVGIARFEARSIDQGQVVQDNGSFLSKLQQLVSTKDQLCVFDPSRNQHIASGVTKGQFQSLVNVDPNKAMGSDSIQTAERILTASGIPFGNLTAADKIKYAVMAASDPSRAADLAALTSTGINLSRTVNPEFRHALAQLTTTQHQLARDIVALHAQSGQPRSTIDPKGVETIANVAKQDPILAGKLVQLGARELGGHGEDGLTNYMIAHSLNDVFLTDARTALPQGVVVPQNLGFVPKFHVQLSDAEYAKVSAAVGRLQADGILTDIHLDPGTKTVHVGYTYQAISDLAVGVNQGKRADGQTSQAVDASAIKTALVSAARASPLNGGNFFGAPPGIQLERAFGNPVFSQDRQNTRFDAIKGMFDKYQAFDYSDHDRDFNDLVVDSLDQQMSTQTGAKNVEYLLTSVNFNGFAIGEEHSSGASKQFLYDNLATMKQNGVNVVMIEHFKQAEVGAMLDAYMRLPKDTPMPADLRAILTTIDRGHKGSESLLELVRKIHDDPTCSGIRIVCGDTENNNPPDNPVNKYEVRMGAMNMVAENNLRTALRPGDKFVILAGAAHNNTHVGLRNGMPGFSQVFGIPALTVTNRNGGDFDILIDREDTTKRTAPTLARAK